MVKLIIETRYELDTALLYIHLPKYLLGKEN
jgi:hypothetical protein